MGKVKKKYSAANERDFKFYLNGRHVYKFAGTLMPSNQAIYDKNGVDGKAAFFSIENHGRNIPTRHPNLLSALLLVKASVNFHIKMWAEGRADGTLPLIEFSVRMAKQRYPDSSIEDPGTDMERDLELSEWVIKAVENQKIHHYTNEMRSLFNLYGR